MKLFRTIAWTFVAVFVLHAMAGLSFAKDNSNDELTQMVINLLSDKDKDMRALGFEQVRSESKGAAATKQFADQLPKLQPDGQVALLRALSDRLDPTALPAVVELLTASHDESVRITALTTIGSLGSAADLPRLLKSLAEGSLAEKNSARAAILQLRGEAVPAAIAAAIKNSPAPSRVALIEILAERRALATAPEILSAAADSDARVRAAAMTALGQMASEPHLAKMLEAVLKAEPGVERDAAEKAVALVAGRIEDPDKRAGAVLSAWSKLGPQDQIALLPALGRVGSAQVLAVVKAAIDSDEKSRREAGLRALCNWPDISVADELLQLTEKAGTSSQRQMLFEAFVRIGSQRDTRSDLERLERMKQAMSAAKTEEEQASVLNRCRTAYCVESLRFVLPYLQQPQFTQLACETIVELAHHREIREPNKTEFDPALDQVIKLSKDPVVVDRANRYKRGETWARPKPADAANVK